MLMAVRVDYLIPYIRTSKLVSWWTNSIFKEARVAYSFPPAVKCYLSMRCIPLTFILARTSVREETLVDHCTEKDNRIREFCQHCD